MDPLRREQVWPQGAYADQRLVWRGLNRVPPSTLCTCGGWDVPEEPLDAFVRMCHRDREMRKLLEQLSLPERYRLEPEQWYAKIARVLAE